MPVNYCGSATDSLILIVGFIKAKQLSDPLPTTSGVRQGCVLAPVLFCVAIDWILRHMKSKPGVNVGRDLFTDLVYADDTAFFVNSPTNATTCLSSFADTASVLGLQISWPKTKTQNLGSSLQPDTILVNGNRVDPVSDFTYLGSSQSYDGQCRPDIRRRIGLASAVMSSLDNIWKDKRLSLSTKLRVYLALVQSVLLYASVTWTLTVADSKSLDAFHMKCQHHILAISWHQFVRNEEVATVTGLSSLSPTFSHLWTQCHSKVGRGSACPQGAPQLHQPISWTSTGPFLEASSWSSTWQVDRPAPKR